MEESGIEGNSEDDESVWGESAGATDDGDESDCVCSSERPVATRKEEASLDLSFKSLDPLSQVQTVFRVNKRRRKSELGLFQEISEKSLCFWLVSILLISSDQG
eukprot:TRINITY_DN3987_c0_g2_i2.p4 TRINITY_DN3987_c0_g2~~TRINITY_DN3987_c0_g2_i2.p4  ORF type:complete len:104 (+),score=26.95 TRINITY_DN3987_c0_g2_i2:521-832(+)